MAGVCGVKQLVLKVYIRAIYSHTVKSLNLQAKKWDL